MTRAQPGRRPRATWAQFLEIPSDPISVMWWEDQCFTEDFAPLVRAVAFYDNFEARVSSDGLGAYIRFGALVPHFESAADCVELHPLLADAAAMIREALANVGFVEDMCRAERGEADAFAMEERHRGFMREFQDRAFALFETLRPRLNRAVLEDLTSYVDIERPTGVTGVGAEHAEVPGQELVWKVRFEDGFPVGPNTALLPGGTPLSVQYSPDHMRVEFDQFGVRCWLDYRTGEKGEL